MKKCRGNDWTLVLEEDVKFKNPEQLIRVIRALVELPTYDELGIDLVVFGAFDPVPYSIDSGRHGEADVVGTTLHRLESFPMHAKCSVEQKGYRETYNVEREDVSETGCAIRSPSVHDRRHVRSEGLGTRELTGQIGSPSTIQNGYRVSLVITTSRKFYQNSLKNYFLKCIGNKTIVGLASYSLILTFLVIGCIITMVFISNKK